MSDSARATIEQYGGVRPFARRFGFPVATVAGWKDSDRIPHWRWAQIEKVLREEAVVDGEAGGGAL